MRQTPRGVCSMYLQGVETLTGVNQAGIDTGVLRPLASQR
jgi:hypothetical protein